MPRVVHITYPGSGGQAAVCLSLAKEAAKADGGEQGIVFYGDVDPSNDYLKQCRNEAYQKIAIRKRGVLGLRARFKLRKWVRAFNPDLVVCHIPDTAISLGFMRCLPRSAMIVNVEHHSVKLKTSKDWLISHLAGWCADRVVFLTPGSKEESLKKLRWSGIFSRSEVISNGVEIPETIAAEREVHEPFIIGMAGRMDVGKDFGILLRAFSDGFAGDDRARLELAGDGPEREEWERMAAHLGVEDKVSFPGMISRSELHRRMKKWSVSVLATKGETLSIAILDSWARGIPVVASDVEGVNNLIRDGVDGLLFHPDSVGELRGVLRRLADREINVSALREAGRLRAQSQFSAAEMWRRYRSLQETVGSSEKPVSKEGNLEPC